MSSIAYDVVVIGAGHNGLVAANYLAKAGLKTLVVEKRKVVGGACVTEELWPGYRINRLAYAYSLFRGEIVKDLSLERYGLQILTPEVDVFVPFGDGKYFTIWSDSKKFLKEIEKFSKRDAEAYQEYRRFWHEVAELFGPLMLQEPPPLQTIAALLEEPESAEAMRRLMFYSVRDFLDEYFESEYVKAAFMARGLIGTFAGPSTPGTAYVLAHHIIGESAGEQGVWGFVKGGMGMLSQALAKALRDNGGELVTGVAVDRIVVKDGEAKGVELEDGRRVEARYIVSNADPKRTLLKLVGEEHLDKNLAKRLKAVKDEGCVVKVNAALSGIPEFRDAPSKRPYLEGIVGIGPSVEYYEKAYFDALVGNFSERPLLRCVIHSILDDTVAPAGKHTLSIFSQYFPYRLKRGSWNEFREKAYENVMNALEEFAPNVRKLVERYEVITPLDMEREFSLPRGNIFHAEIIPSQMLVFRPTIELSKYKTPIKGLYLCGSGTHPGGGVTGAPGYNCAHKIIEELKKEG